MSNLHTWFSNNAGRPLDLLMFRELQITLGTYTPPLFPHDTGHGKSEAWAQSAIRLEASRKGLYLFRNNVGALEDRSGRLVRYGLANDTKQMNETLKSGDLIGWRPVLIQPQHVGHTVAQFVSREVKAPGWQYTGAARESAQLAWANLVNSRGGDAAFATGPGSL